MASTKRSYNQLCPLARTLDIVGERWTLLVIRNLMAGPQRYKDLLDNLPGIGTNLLATRLKELQEAGIIQRRKLAPPAGSTVYEFTELGRGLEDPLLALGKWGMWTMALPPKDAFMPRVVISAGLRMFFRPEAAAGVKETYECRVGDQVFHVRVDDGSMQLVQGAAAKPDLIVTTDYETWGAIASGALSGPEAMAAGRFRFEGEPAAAMHFGQMFRSPTTAAR